MSEILFGQTPRFSQGLGQGISDIGQSFLNPQGVLGALGRTAFALNAQNPVAAMDALRQYDSRLNQLVANDPQARAALLMAKTPEEFEKQYNIRPTEEQFRNPTTLPPLNPEAEIKQRTAEGRINLAQGTPEEQQSVLEHGASSPVITTPIMMQQLQKMGFNFEDPKMREMYAVSIGAGPGGSSVSLHERDAKWLTPERAAQLEAANPPPAGLAYARELTGFVSPEGKPYVTSKLVHVAQAGEGRLNPFNEAVKQALPMFKGDWTAAIDYVKRNTKETLPTGEAFDIENYRKQFEDENGRVPTAKEEMQAVEASREQRQFQKTPEILRGEGAAKPEGVGGVLQKQTDKTIAELPPEQMKKKIPTIAKTLRSSGFAKDKIDAIAEIVSKIPGGPDAQLSYARALIDQTFPEQSPESRQQIAELVLKTLAGVK